MPQFDTSTFNSQIFWLAICLGMVVFCYVRIFIPKFNNTIEKRLSKIRYDLEQAEHMQEQAKLLAAQNQKKLEDAQRHVDEQLKEVLADLEAKKKSQLDHISAELSDSLKAMEKSFERQQAQLEKRMEPLAKECVEHIVQHIINQSIAAPTTTKTKKKVQHVAN